MNKVNKCIFGVVLCVFWVKPLLAADTCHKPGQSIFVPNGIRVPTAPTYKLTRRDIFILQMYTAAIMSGKNPRSTDSIDSAITQADYLIFRSNVTLD